MHDPPTTNHFSTGQINASLPQRQPHVQTTSPVKLAVWRVLSGNQEKSRRPKDRLLAVDSTMRRVSSVQEPHQFLTPTRLL